MRLLRLAGVLVPFAAIVASASAGPVYIEDNTGYLGTITTAGVYTNIGKTMLPTGGVVVLGDLAVTAGGQLYGTNFDGNATNLYSVNTSTGALTLVGSTGAGASAIAGETFRWDGTLFADDGSNLVTLNTTTGAETLVGNMGVTTDGDFAFGGNGAMYMTGGGSLWTIDPSNANATLIGNLGIGTGIYGMAYTAGGLYGFGFDNHVYGINSSTGAATDLGAFSNLPGNWGGTYGADTAPTSAPALPAVIPMLIGMGGAALRRKRRA